MPTVRLSNDNEEAARQIVAWLAYPEDEKRRHHAEIALHWLVIRSGGGTPYYHTQKKAVAIATINSRMGRIHDRFFKALGCGQVSALAVVKQGIEIEPWPIVWSSKISRPLQNALKPKIDGGQTSRNVRKDVIKMHWRPFRTVLHLAAAMNGHLAMNRYSISPDRPLLDLISKTHWIDSVVVSAGDFKKFNNPKMRRFDEGPALIDFVR